MEKKINYADAFAELEKIVQEMESGDIGVDELADKVKRAAYLIDICKQKLVSTEEDVQQILNELNAEG